MAAGRTLQIALAAALALLWAGTSLAAPRVSCLACHPAHYRELGSCVSCHGGDPRSERTAIAHHGLVAARFSWHRMPGAAPVERGNRLLDSYACRRCHTAAGKGNRLASNLDRLPAGTTADEIYDAIVSPALWMPDFRFGEAHGTDLVNAILAGAGASGKGGMEAPQVVHFEKEGQREENLFEQKCGACHRMLTASRGGMGRGNTGPNLSGLFTEFYPASAPGGKRWSREPLEQWLKNPRKARPVTRMRPVPLQEGELDKLLSLLGAPLGKPGRAELTGQVP